MQQSLNLMQKDINLIFNYSDIPYAVNQLSQLAIWKKQILANRQLKVRDRKFIAQPKIYPLQFLSRFIGEEKAIHFISATQARLFNSQALSNLQEISYYTKACKQAKQGLCLWRRSSAVWDKNIQEGGKTFSLLANISSLQFRYIGGSEKNPEWLNSWTTSAEINIATQLPSAIEIILKIKQKNKDLEFRRLVLVHYSKIFIPNITPPTIKPTSPIKPKP